MISEILGKLINHKNLKFWEISNVCIYSIIGGKNIFNVGDFVKKKISTISLDKYLLSKEQKNFFAPSEAKTSPRYTTRISFGEDQHIAIYLVNVVKIFGTEKKERKKESLKLKKGEKISGKYQSIYIFQYFKQ